MPSSQVLIYDLVGKEDLPNALSLSASSRYVAQFFGPLIGGTVLMGLFGPGGGLVTRRCGGARGPGRPAGFINRG